MDILKVCNIIYILLFNQLIHLVWSLVNWSVCNSEVVLAGIGGNISAKTDYFRKLEALFQDIIEFILGFKLTFIIILFNLPNYFNSMYCFFWVIFDH